ncbi:MAG: phosphoribosylamine--glycine ligase [Clostridium sp.]|uniref:phosphoribosylamine--glycine ligase n=1 Tax=Clostridium sp. TaxID=1506 RepID=UPI003062B133
MKILVVGNGGREHAIAWKLSESEKVSKIYCAPGNGGTFMEKKCENVNIIDNDELLKFALNNSIDLTVVGPEVYLCNGIVDLFKSHNLKIFGPNKKAANLEGSKTVAKEFMRRHGVKTAAYSAFNSSEEALKYVETSEYPIVIKADGLAAGKGVIIAVNKIEAISAINEFMIKDTFSGAGKEIIIEEFLQGVEASILSITDGNTIIPFISSRDHKTIFEDNKGPNTGGMGTVAPNPYCNEKILEEFKNDILEPTLKGIKEENLDYTGIIFFGLMINEKGVYLLEYNVRMGDPETQVVLPLMESSLLDLIEAAIAGKLKDSKVVFKNRTACCVIGASEGYPSKYKKGEVITGIESCSEKIFVAGAEEANGKIITSGGRVLGVTSIGDNLEEAMGKAYNGIAQVEFNGMYYRKDIGK